MALDPRISLATTVPDLGRTFSNILTNIASLDTIRENRETAPLRLQALKDIETQRSNQSQLTQEQLLQTKLANTSNRDKQRIASIAPFAASIIPDLQTGNYEAVKQQVIHRQNFLQSQIDQGMLVDRTETDQLMEVLNTNPSQALPIVQAAANMGKMLQAKSAGQRQFESLISDFTQDQQKDAKLVAAGLKGKATGAAPQIVDVGGVPHVFNKQTGKLAPVEVEGERVTSETVGDSKAIIKQREKFGELTGASRSKAIDKGFDTIAAIDKNTRNLDRAIKALNDGAETGAISHLFPSVTAASRQLKRVQNELALDVIGSVTFGALSEGELKLAQDTALDTGLSETALLTDLQERKVAQLKLRSYLNEQIQFLDQGGTVAGFLRQKEIEFNQRQIDSPQNNIAVDF